MLSGALRQKKAAVLRYEKTVILRGNIVNFFENLNLLLTGLSGECVNTEILASEVCLVCIQGPLFLTQNHE